MLRSLLLVPLLFSAQLLAGELKGVNPEELLALQKHGALVVDIRTPEEWQATGVIAGSAKLTYFDKNGAYDKVAWLKQLRSLVKSSEQPVVLVCRSGNRSAIVGKELAQQAGLGQAYHLEKGIRQWAAESGRLESP